MTIQDFLQQLPEPHRSQALKNSEFSDTLQNECDSLVDALMDAFIWDSTIEGYIYWSDICSIYEVNNDSVVAEQD